MIYGYLRVSTDKQTLENQEFEIKTFCEREHISIDKWITETISGTKDFEKRKLGKLLKKLKKGDILICSEISRLGRNLLQIMPILNICSEICIIFNVSFLMFLNMKSITNYNIQVKRSTFGGRFS